MQPVYAHQASEPTSEPSAADPFHLLRLCKHITAFVGK